MIKKNESVNQSESDSSAITARLLDFAKIEQVLNEVARKTVQEHARAGRKIPVWRDGQVVWILPEIEDDGEK
ncbi:MULTISPECIES: hypothetical protein [Symmachiella]|uniref:Uncharacterized protein n=1 Tax=Symmachiella macrocystis TaxID=2527985 RepID=A0A5C6BD13_9PLAN|nr:hypothetical protein [Symmachiella macrocystis]TWU09497.1 hypothetical protein CA54_47390 [Symmachiella macrocystis]|tara:strand:+ start:526 stop:741 length:216 start_codon:yes stop_codon:yes gene_type:complete